MDRLIDEGVEKEGKTLDFTLIKSTFESKTETVNDQHVIDTLFSILDFQKFKEMMLAFKLNKIDVKGTSTIEEFTDDWAELRAKLKEDAYILINNQTGHGWKMTHDYKDRKAYCLDNVDFFKGKLKCLEQFHELTKMDVIMRNVNFEELNDTMQDGDAMLKNMQEQGGNWMEECKFVKKWDNKDAIM